MTDLTALVGSRICHDLISPIGAIGNGMELLAMSTSAAPGGAPTEELALITDSVERANARIRLFRLAFGAAPPEAEVAGREVCDILANYYGGGRLTVTADPPSGLPRMDAKIALLAVLCAETAFPRGGRIALTFQPGEVTLSAEGPKMTLEDRLWHPLTERRSPADELRAAEVQFALLPLAAIEAGRYIKLRHTETRLDLTI
ncbi:Signal transduction histidine kinase [Rhodovulum sp. P5]|uniref:histidine phosphotransferase family protein n=1 Tax=Rhodovulum sp. P5 TaxID=1564506 RepID=UPI0009C34B05|nr:histidine phosphotransferase family protein [Rhodovulum sp. P5]ARE39151.1 Signal transduction histidine kinase [Rhodovulum sp. P5]